MKKKVFSLMAVVMFMSTIVSATPKVKFEEFGRASDCARYWRNAILTLAANNGADANTDMINPTMSYMEAYMIGYNGCLND
ncbi:hypothetical protein [Winogradskyella sp. 4-2091]|uniref:hypothetical protein n=1 Tax=Winogradskyella sp. 4-2091 TaxID=3381659 RepID=UPI003891A342